jgi:hypothetical protein
MSDTIYLTIERNKLLAEVPIRSENDLARLKELTGLPVYVSSSVDFPEEYTDDGAVVCLAKAIRGGKVRAGK